MIKKRFGTVRLFVPLIAMLALLTVVLLENRGLYYGGKAEARALLPQVTAATPYAQQSDAENAHYLIAYDASDAKEAPFFQTLCDTLDSMRIAYRAVDISQDPLPPLHDFTTLLLCSSSLSPLADAAEEIITWVEAGGHWGLLMAPNLDNAFRMLYHMLGIVEYGEEFEAYTSCVFPTKLLPLIEKYHDEDGRLEDYLLPVRLEEACVVHMETGGEQALPLMWESQVGKGRIAVMNNTLLSNKATRGLVLAVLTALEDTLVYPIMNAAMVFVDDFPAPQPKGFDEDLLRDFGYDIQGFFRHHWWPEMKRLTWEYGVAYTGVLIETYNDRVEPPFEPEDEVGLLRFYASELLHSGGELGLHGYNHMPLCLEGFVYEEGLHYVLWPTAESMKQSLEELYSYGMDLLPQTDFRTYVPPSNYLSEGGQAVLRETLPDVRIISGLYLSAEGSWSLVQEFREEADGSISVPRLTSGYVPTQYNWLVAAGELALHGVYSHFIHPDDVLDEARGGALGWQIMYSAFADMIASIDAAYPALEFRNSTDGAAAVQRYGRLSVARQETQDGLNLTLGGFYDDAWLALRARKIPASIEGGKLHLIQEGFYWIHATSPEVKILWEADS